MPEHCAAVRQGAHAAPHEVRAAAWDLRVLRALPFATVCALTAAAAHAYAAGGAVPPAWALAAGFTAVAAAAVLLGGRERPLAAIAGGLAVGQLALHLLFHSAQAHGSLAGAAATQHAGGGRPASATLFGQLLCAAGGAVGAPALPAGVTPEQLLAHAGLDPSAYPAPVAVPWWQADVLGVSPLMAVCHLVAALFAGWWLRQGEAALWRLVRLAGATAQAYAAPVRIALAVAGSLLRGLLGVRPQQPVRRYGTEWGGWRLPAPALLRHAVIRRGPPAAVAAI